MGACCVSETTKRDNKKVKEFQEKPISQNKLENVGDVSYYSQKGDGKNENFNDKGDQIIFYIEKDSLSKIEELVNRGEIDLNKLIFGGNQSILHKAVCRGDHPKIVEFLLNSGAKIDTVETMTGSTSLFFACIDLKVEVVEVLLKFNPNLEHKNNSNQNVFEHFMEFFDPSKNGKSLSEEERKRYNAIMERLETQKRKMKYTEELDK